MSSTEVGISRDQILCCRFERHGFGMLFPDVPAKVLDGHVVLEVSWEEGGGAGLLVGRGREVWADLVPE